MSEPDSGAIKIKRGLDLPIEGAPVQEVDAGRSVVSCAVTASDFVGLKPRMLVEEGERVRLGQPLFEDKRFDGVKFTSPAGGVVRAINRGARRVLQSVVIQIDENDPPAAFETCDADAIDGLSRDQVVGNLLASGLWTALRTRPYSKIPDPASAPAAIFVTAMDTRPLSANPAVVIGEASEDFANGVRILARLTDGTCHVCHAEGADLPRASSQNVRYSAFSGQHPAGLVGTHIHFLEPVGSERTVWHIGYQDAIAVGELFRTGVLPTRRVVALSGPAAKAPRLLRTRVGAFMPDLAGEELADPNQNVRLISGDVLSGRAADEAHAYLGMFDSQITLLPEGDHRDFFGWIIPSIEKFSTARVHLSSLFGLNKLKFHTNLNGSPRAMVPVGLYEEVMPLDILATQLLRAILVSRHGYRAAAWRAGAGRRGSRPLLLCVHEQV